MHHQSVSKWRAAFCISIKVKVHQYFEQSSILLLGKIPSCGDIGRIWQLETYLRRSRYELEAFVDIESKSMFLKRSDVPAKILKKKNEQRVSKPNIQAFGGCLCTTGIALLAIRQCEDFSLFRIWTQYFRVGSNLSSHGRLCSALSLWRRAPWMVTSQYLLCSGSGVWFGFYNFDKSHSRHRRTDLWNWKKSSDMYHWTSVLMSSSHKDKSSRSICRSCFGPIPWRGSRVWFSLGFSIALVIDSWSCSVYFMTCGLKINVSVDSVVTVFTTFERNPEPYPGDGWNIYFVFSLSILLDPANMDSCIL